MYATPSYLKVSEAGVPANGSASNYNVKYQLQNGGIVVTFKNANIQSSAGILLNGNYSVPLTVIGEGKNTLKSTGSGNNTLQSYNDMELKGSFDTIAAYENATGKVATGVAIFSKGNIRMNANIQNLGQPESRVAMLSDYGGITISGNIGQIRSYQKGMTAEGDIQIDGTIGRVNVTSDTGPLDVTSDFCGIVSNRHKLIINNSVGPIELTGRRGGGKAALGYTGIELGEGISLLLPKNGAILYSNYRYVVCDENGYISRVAQFVKAAASAPATGDSMNIVLWASLLTLSLIGIAVLSRRAKREY